MKMPKIEQRGDTYSVRLSYKDNKGHRRQLRLTNKSKTALKKEYINKINEVNKGTFIEPSREKFSDYIDEWLDAKKNNTRSNTYDTYTHLINKHIKPALGHMQLKNINAVHLEKLYNKMKDQDYADWTVFKAHTILSMAFNKAKRYKLILEDPTELVDAPKVHKKEMDYWDEEEARKFFFNEEIMADRLYLAFLLPFTTGMRQGEVLGLKFSDINYDKKYLEVKRIANYKHQTLGSPKTPTSMRRISLDDHTIDAIKKHRKMILEEKLKAGKDYEDQDLVICNTRGGMINPSNLRRTWNKLVKVSENRYIRYHDLRHTHATLMLQIPNADIKMVSERLGHKDIKITLETYYHVLPGKQEIAAQQFGERFFGKKLENDQKKTTM